MGISWQPRGDLPDVQECAHLNPFSFSQPPATQVATPATPTASAPDALALAASEAGVVPASSGDASTLQLADGTVLDPSAVAVTDGSDMAV